MFYIFAKDPSFAFGCPLYFMTYFSGVRMMASINTNDEILKIAYGCFQGCRMKDNSNVKKFIISGTRFLPLKLKLQVKCIGL